MRAMSLDATRCLTSRISSSKFIMPRHNDEPTDLYQAPSAIPYQGPQVSLS